MLRAQSALPLAPAYGVFHVSGVTPCAHGQNPRELRSKKAAFFVTFVAFGVATTAVSACCSKPPTENNLPFVQASASEAIPEPKVSRCAEPETGATLLLGDTAKGSDEDLLPFAPEIGDGISYSQGFAVGVLTRDQGSHSTVAQVITLSHDGTKTKAITVGAAHGDTQPPRVVAKGDILAVGLLDSEPNGRRLRIGRISEGAMAWTANFEQGRDESFAFDIALGESRGVAVWDDDAKGPDRGVIRLATFQADTLLAPTIARDISPIKTDAEIPRILVRPGGFWLIWIARRPERVDDNQREPGEEAQFRWLEIQQLDQQGALQGSPKAITPRDGHVLTYSAMTTDQGGLFLVYRDDDTPSGSSGGVLMKAIVRPDGTTESSLLADSHLGVGSPALLSGWLSIGDMTEETRLAKITPSGILLEALVSEPKLGRGEVLAAHENQLLVAQPRGVSVKLFVTNCTALPP